jgi:methionine-rich copper-binding protein CopC
MTSSSIRHPVRAAACLSVLAGALFLGGAGQAWAHAHPVQESPAPGSTVTAPTQVRITYDDPLEPALSHINVLGEQGKKVNKAKSEVEDGAHKVMRVALPPLSAGKYQVQWVAVAADGHRTHGHYTFTVK